MFLGLDLGTSNVKALVVLRDGTIVAEGSRPVERSTGPDGRVEQDLDEIWEATCLTIGQVLAEVDRERIEAVGVSSQGGAMQLLDGIGNPLGPVISWLDTRARPFNRQIETEWGEEYLVEHTGCNLSTTSLGQLMRLRRQSPELLDAASAIGFVGDLIVGRLCGRRAHDATSLSLAMLYNPALDQADPELLARLGIGDKHLPDLLHPTEPAGRLTAGAAQATDLLEGLPVSAAIHDQYAAALAAGVVAEGDLLVGTGTAWVLLAVAGRLARPVAARTFVCRHLVDGLFGQLLSMGNAGAVIEWVLALTGRRELDGDEVDRLLELVPAGADGLRFRPPAQGSPGASLRGITVDHAADHLLRAVFEGLACELARHLRWFAAAGCPIERLVLSGPAAAGRVLPQIIANVTGRPVTCIDEPAVSALGAAVVARAMVEGADTLSAAAREMGPDSRAVEPDGQRAAYQNQLGAYLQVFADTPSKE